jgi:hypothetical protein
VAVVLAAPPQVHPARRARGGDPVGGDQGAVEDDVGVAGGLGSQQRPAQRRLARGEHVDGLVAVGVGGGRGDGVVAGQLGHAGVVEQPAQRQHRLLAGGQRSGALPGAPAYPLAVEQLGQEHDAVLGHIEDNGVCDTHGGAEPLYR